MLSEEKYPSYDSIDIIKSHLSITGHPQRKLSPLQLTTMVFTLTCAGPFGLEAAVQSGGILYTLIGLLAISFVYSLPQSLMCSELGSMMPSYHGYIIWVYRAFGDIKYVGNFIAFYNSIAEVFALGADIPIYSVIMSYYFERLVKSHFPAFSFTFWTSYIFKLIMIFFGAVFNILNIKIIGNSSIIFSVITVLPFFIGFFYSIRNTDISTWLNTTPFNESKEPQWGVFISSLLWLNTGWDSVGALTAELNFPKSRIIASFAMAILFVYATYTVSVLAAVTVPCDTNDCWQDGYLYVAFDQISVLLGLFVIVSGFMASFSTYIAELSVQARLLWALSQPYVILLEDGTMYVQTHDNKYVDDDMYIIDFEKLQKYWKCRNHQNVTYQRIRIGILPHWLCGTLWSKTGAPVRGVVLQSLVCAVLILFDFATLLQGTVLINAITWSLEFLSFLVLRYKEPNTRRPYKVPGGMFVAWLITVDKLILVAFVMYFIMYDTPWYLYVLIGDIGIVLTWYLIYHFWCKANVGYTEF